MKQVVLQSGAKVGLCLLKPEDLKLNVLASGTVSAKNKVTEKFLTIRVSNCYSVIVCNGVFFEFEIACAKKIQLEGEFLLLVQFLENILCLMDCTGNKMRFS